MRGLLLGFSFLLAVLLAPLAAADPFGGSDTPAAPVTAPSPNPISFSGSMVGWIAHQEMTLNRAFATEFRLARTEGSSRALATVLIIAFLWGVLHAAGPGHGKMVVASFFVAHEARWTSGILMGSVISLLQGVTAILLVGVLALILPAAQMHAADRGPLVELVSYGLVTLIGCVLFWRALTGQGHTHSHGFGGAPDHGHHDHAHNHGHDHDHDHDHDHHHPAAKSLAAVKFRRIMTAASGVAPCASAIIIMLFALANDALWVGVVAVLALSLGMGLTISGIGVLSILARKQLMRIATAPGHGGERLERLLALVGAVAVIGFSGLLAFNAWEQL